MNKAEILSDEEIKDYTNWLNNTYDMEVPKKVISDLITYVLRETDAHYEAEHQRIIKEIFEVVNAQIEYLTEELVEKIERDLGVIESKYTQSDIR